jgi:predicted transcriptional regulator
MRGAYGLGELEAEVMAALWENAQPITVRHTLTALHRPAAYTTVMTVMDNLHRKGLLTRERHRRAYHYRPVWGREEYTARLHCRGLRRTAAATSGTLPRRLMA